MRAHKGWSLTMVVLGLVGLTGCLTNEIPTELTAAQEQEIAAALDAIGGLADVSQSARIASRADEEGDVTTLKKADLSALTFGECPEITITGSGGAGSPSLMIDFGTGCTPEWAPDLACAGSMTGSISFLTRDLSFDFADYTCGVLEYDGSMAYGWTLDPGETTLTTDTDLTIRQPDEDTVTYTGSGVIIYTSADATTTFSTFDGSLTTGTEASALALTNLPVSYPTYSNYVPFGGSSLLTEVPTGDTLEVFYDPNSPITGEVQVSINGGRLFNYTLGGF